MYICIYAYMYDIMFSNVIAGFAMLSYNTGATASAGDSKCRCSIVVRRLDLGASDPGSIPAVVNYTG